MPALRILFWLKFVRVTVVWHLSVLAPISPAHISWNVDRGCSLSQVTVATVSQGDAAPTTTLQVHECVCMFETKLCEDKGLLNCYNIIIHQYLQVTPPYMYTWYRLKCIFSTVKHLGLSYYQGCVVHWSAVLSVSSFFLPRHQWVSRYHTKHMLWPLHEPGLQLLLQLFTGHYPGCRWHQLWRYTHLFYPLSTLIHISAHQVSPLERKENKIAGIETLALYSYLQVYIAMQCGSKVTRRMF